MISIKIKIQLSSVKQPTWWSWFPCHTLPSLQALWSARNSTSPIWRSARRGLRASPHARSAARRRAPPHRPAERRSQRPWRASPRHPWGKRRNNLRETMGNHGFDEEPQEIKSCINNLRVKLMYFVWFFDGNVPCLNRSPVILSLKYPYSKPVLKRQLLCQHLPTSWST